MKIVQNGQQPDHQPPLRAVSSKTKSAALSKQRRNIADANKRLQLHVPALDVPVIQNAGTQAPHTLKISFLGGLHNVGEKNMAVLEYDDQAIILDCGNNLSIDLPGVNYEINDVSYLETIKHNIKAYVITHGHLDHMGGLKHIVPHYPAPMYGSRFTIGVIEKSFLDDMPEESTPFKPTCIIADIDNHSQLSVGVFGLEFIRVTHSLPDAAAIRISTPVGVILATGDFRLDPEPLDRRPTDIKRLQALGDQGVLLLLSESSYADCEGRVPTESTLQQSFYDIIDRAEGRIFVAAFSSNMNRTQMILNAAIAAGRQVVLDGRGMLSYAEIAVRQGLLKIPKGTIIPITQTAGIADNKLLIMCTGGQGEPNAALQRMSDGEHRSIKLHAGDTVVISSSPIPGNEVAYDAISNKLKQLGVHLFRHPTHEIDGCGPLHVSGHARRDELSDMLRLTRPRFFIPVHGGSLRRSYHAELAIQNGMQRDHVLLLQNGDSISLSSTTLTKLATVPHGSVLVDDTGSSLSPLVVKDRVRLEQSGMLFFSLTIDSKTGQLVSSPSIVSRGFIDTTSTKELFAMLRKELKRAVTQRFGRLDIDQFKREISDYITQLIYSLTGRSPIVIAVVSLVGGSHQRLQTQNTAASRKTAFEIEQQRFQIMREKLLKKT